HPKHLDDQSAAAVADAVAAAADGPWPGQLLGRAGLWQLEIRQSDSCFRFDRRSQTTGELESGSASSAVVVRFSDVSGVDLMSGSGYRQHRYLCICRYTRRKRFRSISAVFSAKASTEDSSTAGKVGSRRRSVLLFQLSRIVGDGHSASSAEINLAVLRSVQQTCQQALRGSLCSPDSDLINWSKPVLALANPVSGRGRAVPLFRSVTMTVLQEADIAYRLVETEYSGYARSLIREDPSLMAYGAIVAVGGDGLVHEMLNGLVDRFFDSGNDAGGLADALRRMPLACLPAGSGNGLGASLAFANGDKLNSSSENFLTTCTFNLTRSSPRPLDLAYVELLSSGANRQIVSFLSPINYGFLARIDFESERWRGCLGGARFAADFVSRLASPRSLPSCRARLAYLPAEAAAAGAEFCRNASSASTSGRRSSGLRSLCRYLPTGEGADHNQWPETAAASAAGWVALETDFLFIMIASQSHMATDMYYAPGCNLNDGQLYVTWVETGVSRTDLARMFLNLEAGEHVKCDNFRLATAVAFRLEPLTQDWMGVDGEPVDCGVVQGEILPGLGCVLAPC
ncbi:hypothetical protein BOX15_Mlig023030g3, partial [Macrostomum lignano]